ncbi:MAG TPA: hypothetical protein VNU21_14035 [Usitatibacter sp.]|jgi:ribonuclease HepT-like protein|nr:hypothetical protein [Usitatibacter sp.]
MSDDRWIEVRSDFQSAQRHFETAQKLYVRGSGTDDEDQEQVFALAFMHAMQAGYTSLESGMVRIMTMVHEDVPQGEQWHADVVRRMSQGIDGKRPALLASSLLPAVNETRKFRHVATHTYDDFNWADARRPVEAARVIAASLADVLREFQQRLDPRSK